MAVEIAIVNLQSHAPGALMADDIALSKNDSLSLPTWDHCDQLCCVSSWDFRYDTRHTYVKESPEKVNRLPG